MDAFETWRKDLFKRIQANTETPVDYLIGAKLMEAAAGRAEGADANELRHQPR